MNIIKNIQKAIAFTLAETLVVMGIIGVVAALTIPNLNQSTGDREKVAKVKKIYANLSDAYGRATAVYGPFEEWFNGIDEDDKEARIKRYAERIIEFMKVSKNCEFDEGCFSTAPLLWPDGREDESSNYVESLMKDSNFGNAYMVILADGTALAFRGVRGSASNIKVDIDGPNKGKTMYGNDIFDFIIDSNEQYDLIPPSGGYGGESGDFTEDYVTAWVIQNGNLDYLKCDDLNWETKTSCK